MKHMKGGYTRKPPTRNSVKTGGTNVSVPAKPMRVPKHGK